MKKTEKLKALDALDVSILLSSLYSEQALGLIFELVKKVHYLIREDDYCISIDCHYHVDEEYIKMKEHLKSFGLTLVDLQRSIIESESLQIKVDIQIDIKELLLALPSDYGLEIIDECLGYIEVLSPFEEFVEKGQDIAELKELKATLTSIREEEIVNDEHSEEWDNLPF